MTYENIIVQAEDVWKTAQSEWAQLRTHLKKIAENPEFGVVIYLTVDNELVQILVYVDDNELYSEQCVSELDCKTTARKIYSEYLSEKVLDKFFGEEEDGSIHFKTLTSGNFYFDIIDSNSSSLGIYSVDNIGRRADVVNDDNVNCLFTPEIPNVVFLNSEHPEQN